MYTVSTIFYFNCCTEWLCSCIFHTHNSKKNNIYYYQPISVL